MNFYRLFLFFFNILLVYCLEQIQECKNFENWIAEYKIDYSDFQCCNSEYVKCNESRNHILEINLENKLKKEIKNNFTLNALLDQFPKLEKLDIRSNDFEGNLIIPEKSNLVELDVSSNHFNGNISIPENSKLETLDIRRNDFEGNLIIPEKSNLVELYVSFNNFNGKISIPENSKLETLDISINDFEGNLIIPEKSNLVKLDVSSNHFNGKISIPENSKLEALDISNNEFTGDLTVPLSLVELNAENNHFNGKLTIPENSEINAFFNYQGYSRLKELSIYGNNLSGNLIIPKNCTLESLYASNNNFNGELNIPEDSKLEYLDATNNHLTGDIIIPKNSKLKELYLKGNDFNSYPCSTQINISNDFPDCFINSNDFILGLILMILALVLIFFIGCYTSKFSLEKIKNKKEKEVNDDLSSLIINKSNNDSNMDSNKNINMNSDKNSNLNPKTNSSFKIGYCYKPCINYKTDKEDGLTFNINDRIQLLEIRTDDYGYGKNINTQQVGSFPLKFLKHKKENLSCILIPLFLLIMLCIIYFATFITKLVTGR